ncbi:uncharacterized protein LOC111026185 [Myzus persicae]|uniref:uncharacterized protein LOC111026185 n=1 Tax=Myzus persicae TaxID=13164 RepID=UPI000B9360AE|nr:uncharacterized protein LOC111026185 [Myzus persicae]
MNERTKKKKIKKYQTERKVNGAYLCNSGGGKCVSRESLRRSGSERQWRAAVVAAAAATTVKKEVTLETYCTATRHSLNHFLLLLYFPVKTTGGLDHSGVERCRDESSQWPTENDIVRRTRHEFIRTKKV